MFQDFLNCKEIYKLSDIYEILEKIKDDLKICNINKKVKYYNIPCAFDIETSSFFRPTGKDMEKVAIMYEWTFGIDGIIIIGRTWKEFIELLHILSEKLGLFEKLRLIVYVHNLSYEFQFMRKWLKWEKVFSLESRKPIYSISELGIEFRCSYLLSGYNLEKLGENLRKYMVKKLVGNLDYDKIRHSKTPLTEKEIAYCVNDVKVVMAHIKESIENDGNIARIPLTKTGYVRNYCRNNCFYENGNRTKKSHKRARYREIMVGLTLEPNEYEQLKKAFQGGFTHANPFFSGKMIENVTSFDFTSSYPTVMIAEKYPMTKGELINITSKEEFEESIKYYCCLFDMEVTGIESKILFESYISQSRCKGLKNAVVNNGRIVKADYLIITVTEQDYNIIRACYNWDKLRIGNFRRYMKDYLPTDFIKAILKLYEDKTTLKGVEDKEIEYLKSKEMLNSCYGMCVTDIVRPEYAYEEDWLEPKEPELIKAINDYNKSSSRFLFYPWGVWVTAYARRNLFTGILEFSTDYIYSDTDSIKVRNAENHMEYINKYNDAIRERLCKAMDYHGIDRNKIEPKTIKGVKKCMGLWDFDGHYQKFKTLGAKRYMVQYSNDSRNSENIRGKYNITVAGLNKQICVPYLLEKYREENIFKNFTNNLYVPPEYTGKNTHTYIDDRRTGYVKDYMGVIGKYDELSAVHLEKADYSLSLSREYVDYLLSVETKEI